MSKKAPFDEVEYKRLLLNFIVSNNISFRAITTPSFKELTEYLNE